jgi:hypothetical protein
MSSESKSKVHLQPMPEKQIFDIGGVILYQWREEIHVDGGVAEI